MIEKCYDTFWFFSDCVWAIKRHHDLSRDCIKEREKPTCCKSTRTIKRRLYSTLFAPIICSSAENALFDTIEKKCIINGDNLT